MVADFGKPGAFYVGRGYDAGRTGLCISLPEDAALDGIPSLVTDPKGGIANPMLTFPGLVFSERDDVARADESLDPAKPVLETLRVAPRKSGAASGRIASAWEPRRAGPDGFPQPVSVP